MGFADKIKNLLSKKEFHVGLDMGSSFVKFVQLRDRGGAVNLETYGEIGVGPYVNLDIGEPVKKNEEAFTQAIKELFNISNLKENTYYNIAISASSSLIFNISIPKIPQKYIRETVMNEARKYVPVPLEEVYVDWWEIPIPERILHGGVDEADDEENDSGEKMEILVGAIRKNSVDMYKNILEGVGIKDYSFEIGAFGGLKAVYSNEISPIACVDIGASGASVAIGHYGIIRRLNHIPNSSYGITETIRRSLGITFKEAEELKKNFAVISSSTSSAGKYDKGAIEEASRIIGIEVKKMVRNIKEIIIRFEKDNQMSVSKIYLYGAGSKLYGLADYLNQDIGIEVVFANPFARVQNPAYIQKSLELHGPEFAVALGSALNSIDKQK